MASDGETLTKHDNCSPEKDVQTKCKGMVTSSKTTLSRGALKERPKNKGGINQHDTGFA